MAENSPVKQGRVFHPYGRVKSPLKTLQNQKQALILSTSTSHSLSNKMSDNFFSFSGGSSSLFPNNVTTTSRTAMTEVSSIVNAQKQQHFNSIFNKDVSIVGAKPSMSIFVFEKGKLNNKPPPTQMKGPTVTFGAIGSRRPFGSVTSGKPLTGSGFIPVQHSFTIWGDCSTNAMEFTDKVEIEEKNDENTKTASLTSDELQRSKTVRKNLFQLETGKTDVQVEPATSRGILTERKHEIYDQPEYALDIYKHWLKYESRVPIKPHYMEKQEDITHNMRSILIDWMVEVGQEYDFQNDTIFLAVAYLDRFLGRMAVVRNKLQLVGTAAIYIAAKLQEVDAPSVTDVVHITDKTYSKEQVLIMEGIMLRTIQFDLMVPTAADFLRALALLLAMDTHVISLALYLVELSMMDGERFLRYKPSVIATAAIALARFTHENNFWDEPIEMFSKLTYTDVRIVSGDLLNAFYEAPSVELTAVYEKYKSVRYNCVSFSILPPILPLL